MHHKTPSNPLCPSLLKKSTVGYRYLMTEAIAAFWSVLPTVRHGAGAAKAMINTCNCGETSQATAPNNLQHDTPPPFVGPLPEACYAASRKLPPLRKKTKFNVTINPPEKTTETDKNNSTKYNNCRSRA